MFGIFTIQALFPSKYFFFIWICFDRKRGLRENLWVGDQNLGSDLSLSLVLNLSLDLSLSLAKAGGRGLGRGGEMRGGVWEGRGLWGWVTYLKCYIHTYIQTYIHTDPLTKRVVEELSLLKNVFYIYQIKHI